MKQKRYHASFARGTERKTYTVHAWNKDDAFVEAAKRLERETGERPTGPGGWWYVGAEIER